MSDLISRTEALKYIPSEDLISRMVIAQLPTIEPEPRWIPVTERLPEIGEHYVSDPCIVYANTGAYAFAELEENIFGQVGWNCERDDEYHESIGEVIAWMPLPVPYKVDEVRE